MITVLHISDPQFGKDHRFGSKESFDTLYQRLEDDLNGLRERHGLKPDIVAVTGDLAEWGMSHEFRDAFEFLDRLADHLKLNHNRITIIPGNHDVNRPFCRGYFEDCEGAGEKPVPPFWRKWRPWIDMFSRFYDGHQGIGFTETEPWTLYEMADLKVVVAGLNSTIAESHRDEDHYGYLGELQLRWFSEKLKSYQDGGWLRIGLVHHNPIRGAVNDDENLQDCEDLERILGPALNVILHGHTHTGKMGFLDRNVPIVSTGSAGLKPGSLPSEVPNQYQMLSFSQRKLKRYARYFAPDQKRWIGDTRFSDTGDDWNVEYEVEFRGAQGALAETSESVVYSIINRRLESISSKIPSEGFADIDLVIEVKNQWSTDELILEFRIQSPSGAVSISGVVTCYQSVKGPTSVRHALLEELSRLGKSLDIESRALLGNEVYATIENLGHRLYDRLVPPLAKEICRHSRGIAKTLLLVSDDHWIPWEILKPFDDSDDDHFCLQFEMSRWLSGTSSLVSLKKIKNFVCIAAARTQDQPRLPGVCDEIRHIEGIIAGPGIGSSTLIDPLYADVVRVLKGSIDLFHFAGYGEDGGVGTDLDKIELSDRPFRVRHLSGPLGKRLREDHPVVFINAGGVASAGLGNWAEGWIGLGGASAFLAPLWPIPEISSTTFATALYRELRAKQSLAGAVRSARREVKTNDPGDTSWLTYRVYGHPHLRFAFGEDV